MTISFMAGRRLQGLEEDRIGKRTVSFPQTDYSDTYISIPISGISTLTTGSLSFWFKPVNNTTNTGSNTIFSASHTSDPSSEWIISYTAGSNDFYLINRENGSIRLSFTGGATFTDNTWYHVVYTNDSTGHKVYVNGSQVSLTYSTGNASTSSFFGHVNNVDSTLIGANKDNGSTSQWEFAGDMEQVLIYDDVLTSSEVTTLYNNGNGTKTPNTSNLVRHYKLNGDYNDSVGSNHGTKSGNITFTGDAKLYPATIPTNVQSGSRFEETDTRKIYYWDEGYNIHTFTSSGTLTVTGSGNIEYLIVGGGGAGGAGAHNSGAGAGGGAGGLLTGTVSKSSGSYTVTVGSGGTGSTTYGQGQNGGNSVFDNLTAIGGGGGGYLTSGGTGGSGGGSGNNGTAGASGTAGQGNNGGSGNYRAGGGGGGSGGAGSNSGSSSGGAGGAGTQSSITGTATYYAAGGGGAGDNAHGSGGSGIGGNGSRTAATSGATNTGSGGGGTYVTTSNPAGNGADGIVIIKYRANEITATGGTIVNTAGWIEEV